MELQVLSSCCCQTFGSSEAWKQQHKQVGRYTEELTISSWKPTATDEQEPTPWIWVWGAINHHKQPCLPKEPKKSRWAPKSTTNPFLCPAPRESSGSKLYANRGGAVTYDKCTAVSQVSQQLSRELGALLFKFQVTELIYAVAKLDSNTIQWWRPEFANPEVFRAR